MLDYTKAAIKQIADDFKKIDRIREILTQIIYIAYLVYAIFAKTGVFTVNLVLFLLSVGYFAFFLFASAHETKKGLKKTVKTVYTRCKQLIKLYTLGVMVYGVWLTAENVTPLGLILSALMIVGWIMQILFELVFKFFSKRANLLLEGLEADYENMTKPARSVGNFFKKITGQEVEEKEPSKARQLLEQKVGEQKQERKNQKLEAKFLKKQAKAEEKERKKQEKAERKAAKKKPAAEIAVAEAKKQK